MNWGRALLVQPAVISHKAIELLAISLSSWRIRKHLLRLLVLLGAGLSNLSKHLEFLQALQNALTVKLYVDCHDGHN